VWAPPLSVSGPPAPVRRGVLYLYTNIFSLRWVVEFSPYWYHRPLTHAPRSPCTMGLRNALSLPQPAPEEVHLICRRAPTSPRWDPALFVTFRLTPPPVALHLDKSPVLQPLPLHNKHRPMTLVVRGPPSLRSPKQSLVTKMFPTQKRSRPCSARVAPAPAGRQGLAQLRIPPDPGRSLSRFPCPVPVGLQAS